MTERPILFSDEMVRAILRRTWKKTQTRRTRGLEYINENPDNWKLHGFVDDGQVGFIPNRELATPIFLKCPYGIPGDRLWVREAHVIIPFQGAWIDLPHTKNPADPEPRIPHTAYYRAHFDRCGQGRWRSSVHMPRWASRILLEIVDVRPQRLQEISDHEAIQEGFLIVDSATEWFFALWDRINGKAFPAIKNPWVWAISFVVVEK